MKTEFSVVERNKTNTSNITFTEDQSKAINNIIDFIAKPFDPAKYCIGLVGAGGVGKTFITKYIIDNCIYGYYAIRCTSPTHKACRVLAQAINHNNVETIQSTFGFRLDLNLEDFNPNNPQFNPKGSVKLDGIRLLIVDEASMLPASIVTYILKVCKEKEIKVLFIGDSSQLSPVNERKSIAFNRCFQVNELNQIVRQEDNNAIKALLDILRQDIKDRTYNFLTYITSHLGESNINSNGNGYVICDKYSFQKLIDESFSDVEYTKNINKYRIVAYTNNCVNAWNNYVRNTIIKDSEKGIINRNDLMMSYTTIVDDFLSVVISNSEEYIIHDIVDFVDNDYQFKGFLVKFQLVNGGTITKPLFILDHKDKFTIIQYHNILSNLYNVAKTSTSNTRTKHWKDYYAFKTKYLLSANVINSMGKIIYPRDIDYGFAITSHRAQGSTYENVFVDVNDMIYDKNNNLYKNIDDMFRRLYVACSRAKNKLILCYDRS